jgi:hypothetical protein
MRVEGIAADAAHDIRKVPASGSRAHAVPLARSGTSHPWASLSDSIAPPDRYLLRARGGVDLRGY